MIIDKYSRNKFYSYNDINGIEEADLIKNKFRDFEFKRPKQFYTVVYADIQRPDLISYKAYQRVNYWWIIMKVNGIEDIWNDLTTGKVLTIPNINDIEEFIIKARRSA